MKGEEGRFSQNMKGFVMGDGRFTLRSQPMTVTPDAVAI